MSGSGPGSSNLLGLVAVGAYFVTAALCVWRGRYEQRSSFAAKQRSADGSSPGPLFWWILAISLTMLGIEKQFDLLTSLTDSLRETARVQDWYTGRRTAQFAFIAAVALVGSIGLLAFAWRFRRANAWCYPAICGLCFLITFVIVRAASLHQVDAILSLRILGLKVNWFLELGGIALIALAAIVHPRPSKDNHPVAFLLDDRGPRTYRMPGR